jgi:hypothetical protein
MRDHFDPLSLGLNPKNDGAATGLRYGEDNVRTVPMSTGPSANLRRMRSLAE